MQLDEQFAVLTRIFFIRHNELIDMYNKVLLAEAEASGIDTSEIHPVELIEWTEVLDSFKEFAQLRKRPDYSKHMETWYMGGDVSNLPPPEPEPKEEEIEQIEAAPEEPGEPTDVESAGYPEGAQIFGGDYGTEPREQAEESGDGDEEREGDSSGSPSEATEVPGMQAEDDAGTASANEEAGAVLRDLQEVHDQHEDQVS